ncbi:MAG: 3-hydroxyacyl-CoA dehydrogenase [Bacillus sp. (in: Bacteria)]|nr:3-hydroxyacyl-CoA dehydrogenase [Bacillus sp. (in: firmicutes)]
MNYLNITIAGAGILGSQIAFQTAFKGFNVILYDINDAALESAKEKFIKWKHGFQKNIGAVEEEISAAFNRLSYSTDLSSAVRDADLLIEAIPEVSVIKMEFYKELAKAAPEKTVFATNSSTFLPSQFAEATGRPEKFLSLHFANNIWTNNTAEIMNHEGTDLKVFDEVVEFAKAIGMVALPLHKEQPGYILNSLLVPFLEAAEMLLYKEVADIETIDKTWMLGTGSPIGPFGILDHVGIITAYNIVQAKALATGDTACEKLADYLKTEYINKGRLGKSTGAGFYKYPNPNFTKPDFLKS